MSAEDVELVRRWFEGFGRGELTLEICDPEIEIRNWAEFPITGPYLGHDGVRRWWDDIADAFEDLQYELLELIDVGDDRVVTVQRFVGRFRLTGIEVDFVGDGRHDQRGKDRLGDRLPLTRPWEEGGGAQASCGLRPLSGRRYPSPP